MRSTFRHTIAAIAVVALLIVCRPAAMGASPPSNTDSADSSGQTAGFSQLDNWEIRSGDWKMIEGRLRGEGDSNIVFRQRLPFENTISFRFNVIKGMRPRIYFEGTGVDVADEGAGMAISVFGKTVPKGLKGVPYQNGDEIRCTAQFAGNKFEIHVNDQVYTGLCKSPASIQLRLRAGDFWGKGTTEFWDFSVAHAGTPAGAPAKEAASASVLHSDAVPDDTSIPGPATRPSHSQASINALEIYTDPNGMMLGQTSEATLTLTGSDTPKMVTLRFISKVGDEMSLSRDDMLRYIHLMYPNWYVSKAELTFEDKYVAHDGGSIGTALGTLILSCIQGFDIDPEVAITGDISANGKTRAIGGVSAKIKGAIASKCKLVIIPAENVDQLTDAVIYNGPELVSDVQVLGIRNLDEAVSMVRIDRDEKLAQAIALFAQLQKALQATPAAIHTKQMQSDLQQVLNLAPEHLSARLLLAIARGDEPKTLSAAASQYYTFLAVGSMADALQERDDSPAASDVPSSVVRAGLASLRKLRPMADESVRPLIDAWSRFIGAWNQLQEGIGSAHSVEEQRQSVLDEMARENSDPDLMQKMLKQGM